MVNSNSSQALHKDPYKNEPGRINHSQDLELNPFTILVEALKTLEIHLLSRSMLPITKDSNFYPLWFTIENECNVYLWRQGFSLSEKENFEFWVDVPLLITKRLSKLERAGLNNPFINPAWEECDAEETLVKDIRDEIYYLSIFEELFRRIGGHAHALSRIGSMIRGEAKSELKTRVVIPGKYT